MKSAAPTLGEDKHAAGSTLTARLKAFRRTKLYDLLTAAAPIAWYLYCAAQLLPQLSQQIALVKLFVQTDPSVLPASLVLGVVARAATLVFLAVLVVLFALRRVPQRTAPGLWPRVVAFAGTFLGVGILLLPPHELSPALYMVSLVLMIAGTAFALAAVLVLGRSVSMVPQARRLVTSGPYAVVSHPMYLGELAMMTGIALQFLSVWALLLLGLQFAFQLLRMRYEERVLLAAFPDYADYMAKTARLVPGVY
jgi:protein-S-isoprenylcysteine O-methyltransferase Ste14